MPEIAMAIAIGKADPSIITARTAETNAPIRFCKHPKREDAVPDKRWKGVSALAADRGHTNEKPTTKIAIGAKMAHG